MSQYLLPGGPYIVGTGTRQAQLPGGSYWLDTTSTSGGTSYTITPTGAIILGGVVTATTERHLSSSGLVVFYGTAPLLFTGAATSYTMSPSGSVTLSGNSQVGWGRTIIPNGSFSLSGTTLLPNTKNIIPEGSFTLLGTVLLTKDKVMLSTGTVFFSGTAPLLLNWVPSVGISTKLTLTFAGNS